MEMRGSQTERNLLMAFAGESQAQPLHVLQQPGQERRLHPDRHDL